MVSPPLWLVTKAVAVRSPYGDEVDVVMARVTDILCDVLLGCRLTPPVIPIDQYTPASVQAPMTRSLRYNSRRLHSEPLA